MKKSLLFGSMLIVACLNVVEVEASNTEALREKYADKNIHIEFLLTECRIPEKGYYGEVGWTGSKDSSKIDDNVRKRRPVRPKDNQSSVIEKIETVTDKTYDNLHSDYPRYVKRKYTHIQKGNDVCFKQDYPVYINDDYPEMGVDFYVFESDSDKLESLRKAVEKAENPQSYTLPPMLQAYQSVMSYVFGNGKGKRNAHDLNIITNGKLYLLDRVKLYFSNGIIIQYAHGERLAEVLEIKTDFDTSIFAIPKGFTIYDYNASVLLNYNKGMDDLLKNKNGLVVAERY